MPYALVPGTIVSWYGDHLSWLFGCAQLWDDVDGDGEDDGAVVLGGDAVQRLQVPQLGVAMVMMMVTMIVMITMMMMVKTMDTSEWWLLIWAAGPIG